MMDRFKPPFFGDYVLMIDADVIAIDRFDELFSLPRGISGVIAHGSPFVEEHNSQWRHLFGSYGLDQPRFEFEHSGWLSMFTDEARKMTPYYLNTGVLFGPRDIYEQLFVPYNEAMTFVRSQIDSYFFEQIALTLALERTGISANAIPLRYNFPNQIEFEANNRAEYSDIRLLHFLRTHIVNRDRDFETYDSVTALAAREDLTGSNELLRRRLTEVGFSKNDLADTIGII